jgi:hypothetical protein
MTRNHGEMLASVTSELSHLVQDAYGLSLGPPHPGVARALAYTSAGVPSGGLCALRL